MFRQLLIAGREKGKYELLHAEHAQRKCDRVAAAIR
jgi:hypothetical protein